MCLYTWDSWSAHQLDQLSKLPIYEEVNVIEFVKLWCFVIWTWLKKVVMILSVDIVNSTPPPKVNGVALWCYCLFEPMSYILMSSIKILWYLMYLIKVFLHQPLHMHNIHGNSSHSKSHPTMTMLGKLLVIIYYNILFGVKWSNLNQTWKCPCRTNMNWISSNGGLSNAHCFPSN